MGHPLHIAPAHEETIVKTCRLLQGTSAPDSGIRIGRLQQCASLLLSTLSETLANFLAKFVDPCQLGKAECQVKCFLQAAGRCATTGVHSLDYGKGEGVIVHVLRSHRWLLARLFSWMRFSMKSTASTLRAVMARGPVNRPMPAPNSNMRFSSTLPSIASTYERSPLKSALWLMPKSELLITLALQRLRRWALAWEAR